MNKEIASRLRIYRRVKEISQEKLAEDLHISRSKISSWETYRRDMTITDAILLCNYLQISMDNLFNPICLNSDEFCKIAERYFSNPNVSVEEKNIIVKKLFYMKTDEEVKELSYVSQ